MIIRKANNPVVFKLDVLGMPPEKKYEADEVLTTRLYEEGNCVEVNSHWFKPQSKNWCGIFFF